MSALGRLAGAWLRQRSPTRRVTAWALAVAGPALLALVALPLRSSLVLGGFLFSALLLVIASAVLGGPWPAVTGVALSVLARLLSFAPPFADSGVDQRPNLVSLVAFVVVGVAVAILIGELAQLAEEHASSRRVEASLRRVATLVARGIPPEEVFAAVAREAGQLLPVDSASMCRFESDHTLTFRRPMGQCSEPLSCWQPVDARGAQPRHAGVRDRPPGKDRQLCRQLLRRSRCRHRRDGPALGGRDADHRPGPPVGSGRRRLARGQAAALGHRGAAGLVHRACGHRYRQRRESHRADGFPGARGGRRG